MTGGLIIECVVLVVVVGGGWLILEPQYIDLGKIDSPADTAQTLQSQVELYRFKTGAYPSAATWQDDLVQGGYIAAPPATDDDWELHYIERTGRVSARPITSKSGSVR